jgi:DNA-binding response OmpR family regulator
MIVEDDKALNNGICMALKSNKFSFVSYETMKEAKEK